MKKEIVSPPPEVASPLLEQFVEPWYASLADPDGTQRSLLSSLVDGYSKTEYGRNHNSESVEGIADFRESFPIASYSSLLPYISKVQAGAYEALLSEPPKYWVMTRGSTGDSKVLPATEAHLTQILEMGARCVVNFALKTNMEVLEKPVLNLNFPSEVHELLGPGGPSRYGYSSGTYAKVFPQLQGARLVPDQSEIDALGGGVARADWERRFELAYHKAKDFDVGSVIGVTPVMVSFASYVKREHGISPKGFWKCRALFCTSVAKIQTKYRNILGHYFGPTPIVEMYSATEGVFGQQLDEHPYVSPNYDGYLFEVITGKGVKMLHELRPFEWGRLVVSTPMLPRYAIGDLIESLGKGYFRVFGRDRVFTRAEHLLFRLATGRL